MAALLAFTQQGGHGHVQVLAQQVKHGAFNGGNGMYGNAQVKCLQAAAAVIAGREGLAHVVQHLVPSAQCLPKHQGHGIF